MVRFETAPAAVPLMAWVLTAEAAPAPRVRVTASGSTTAAPRVMAPVAAPPRVVFAVTLIALAPPRLITAAASRAEMVPARLRVVGAVAMSPASKASTSAAPLPRVTVPVLLKVVATTPLTVPPALSATE